MFGSKFDKVSFGKGGLGRRRGMFTLGVALFGFRFDNVKGVRGLIGAL